MKIVEFSSNAFDVTEELEEALNTAPNGICFKIVFKEMFLSRKITIKNKHNFIFDGNYCKIISHFNPKLGFENYSGVFNFEGCTDLQIKRFGFDCDNPVNSAGEIVSVNVKEKTVDVDIFEDCVLDGNQTIFAINSIDNDGTPDYLLKTYKPTKYEVFEKNKVRLYFEEKFNDNLSLLPIGERLCFRFGLGNFTMLKNSAITFHNCSNVIIDDIRVYSSAGYMIVVFPRCFNFRINNYIVKVPENSSRLMASNIDGIHLLGLGGYLEITNSYFDGLGDDAVNIHSTLGTVHSVNDNSIFVYNGRYDIPISNDWCNQGDIIEVYDRNFLKKGEITVSSFSNSVILFKENIDFIQPNDLLGNTVFYAKTKICNCTVRNSRARAFLLQTKDIQIKDCTFFGTSLPAILISPDSDKWHEAGPSENVEIKDCQFNKCSFVDKKMGAVCVQGCHDTSRVYPAGVHKNISITNNNFENIDNAITVSSATGVNVISNVFSNCKNSVILNNCD